MAEVLKDRKYTKTHEWIKEEGDGVLVGLTDYAQDALGDIVFVNLPEVDDAVEEGASFGEVESVKAVSDVYSPVSGTVDAINEEVLDRPEAVNESPYDTWLIRVRAVTGCEDLLEPEAYEALLAETK